MMSFSVTTLLICIFDVIFIVHSFVTWLLKSFGKFSVNGEINTFQMQPVIFRL